MRKQYQHPAPDIQSLLVRMTNSGVRRADIAAAAGIDVDTVGRYITGERSPNWPRGWLIMRFAESRRFV